MGANDEMSREGCPHWRMAKAMNFAEEHLPADKYEHTLRVINYTRELEAGSGAREARIVAALHDVVEDSDVTLDEIEKEFGKYIRNCINVLTHEKEFETYPQYIDRIMDSNLPEARIVKHADMRDHLRQKETLTPKLKEKYFEVIDRFI
jgi:(p)ppGpp synthase/HD superfamily hydrolase